MKINGDVLRQRVQKALMIVLIILILFMLFYIESLSITQAMPEEPHRGLLSLNL